MAQNTVVQDLGTGIKLSLKDLFHEWKLTLCLVFAIAGVVAPLLLLFGLKYGTFTALRVKLVQDPRNREVIPLTTIDYQKEWFEKVAARPDVAFLLPKTREIAVIIYVQVTEAKSKVPVSKMDLSSMTKLDTLPTAPGDILLIENGVEIPDKLQCVLTRLAAERVGAKRGDRLMCVIDRRLSNKYETVTFFLDVIGILPDRAGTLEAIFIPLFIVDAIETYRDGGAVPQLGWPGKINRVQPKFDGFALISNNPIQQKQLRTLTTGTGLHHIRAIETADTLNTFGLRVPEHMNNYLLHNKHDPIGVESLNAVKKKVNPEDVIIIPYVRPVEAFILSKKEKQAVDVSLVSYWASRDTLHKLGISTLPIFEPIKQRQNAEDFLKIAIPEYLRNSQERNQLTLSVGSGDRTLSFPVQVVTTLKDKHTAFIPSELGGIINSFLKQTARDMVFDPDVNDFVADTHDYVSFRMYARTIDDVDPLRQFLAKQGIEALTKAYEIERVKSVDRGLTKIFWLVAVAGLVGCLATLTASFTSSVERKKKDLGIMRLMGMSGWLIFHVPLSQAILIGIAGFVTASAIFFAVAKTINQLFGEHLQAGAAMCVLEFEHFGLAFLGTLGIAILSSLGAAWQAIRIDPADALRDE